MATTQPTNPYLGYWFTVKVTSFPGIAAFAEATLPSISVATASYRDGTDGATLRTLPGIVSYGNITLKRGVTNSLDLYNWVQMVVQTGAKGRKNMSISAIDGPLSAGGKVVANWDLVDVLPIGFETSGFDAKSTNVIFETIRLDIGGFTRTL